MPATDDEIREKYLERAIRELNTLTRDLQSCPHCPRGQLMPVLGSGHPQADIMLLKHAPLPSEVEEGVAFYGRAGGALMKSFKRLSIDPLTVYGTLCVKCPLADASMADPACMARVVEEIAIVQPRIVVVMGPEALAQLNDLDIPLAKPLEPRLGEIQQLAPDDRRPIRAQHRRVPGRARRQARVLGGVQEARGLVRRAAAVLSRQPRQGLQFGYGNNPEAQAKRSMDA